MSSAQTAQFPLQKPPISSEAPKPLDSIPRISIINAAAFACACKLPSTQFFRIHLSDTSVSRRSASIPDEAPDLSGIPEEYEYHDFADIFSKQKADTLAPHQLYNLKINLEEGATPPIGPMYSLFKFELSALCEFIDEHICIGFIWFSKSPHSAPILFVHKKDGSLWLCVNFHGLNKISKKNCYLLPFTSDLLSTAGKACIYTTIDLYHAYHLVHITEDDKWKTAFL